MLYQKIIGLEAPTEEFICTLAKEDFQVIKEKFRINDSKVEFWEDSNSFTSLLSYLHTVNEVQITSGGTISNTLHSLTLLNYGDNKKFDVELLGAYHKNNYTNSNNPLDSLRQLGVRLNLINNLEANRKGICIIDNDSKEVLKIILYPNSYAIEPTTTEFNYDYLLITLQRLESISEAFYKTILSRQGKLILLFADYNLNSPILISRFEELFLSQKIIFLFGQFKEFAHYGIINGDTPLDKFKSAEIIGTNGKEDVFIWNPTSKTFGFYSTNNLKSSEINSTLGAGDTYCGCYLWSRLSGETTSGAHKFATAKAANVLKSSSSRLPFKIDLNKYYGTIMNGRNGTDTNEHDYYHLIRNNCGFAIISCGQTGVDQIGLQVANDLGLALYSLMPKGQRTERTEGITSGSDNLYNAFTLEYSSHSYRFTTYSTVFMSDGTLIFDYAESEGCQATRDACNLIGRPFLDLAHLRIEDVSQIVYQWIIKNGIRVINVAGNRERFLSANQLDDCYRKLSLSIRHICVSNQNASEQLNTGSPVISQKKHLNETVKISISNSSESKKMVRNFISNVFNYNIAYSDTSLVWKLDELRMNFYFIRSRDIPFTVKNSLCDIGFCGNDIIVESGLIFSDAFNTGIQPCMIVEVKSKQHKETKVIGTQYPTYCRKVYQDNSDVKIQTLQGSAEAWLVDGWCDTILDTWRTGKTAYLNNLQLHKQIDSTFLHIISEKKSSAALNFIALYKHWLYGYPLSS